jgi:hypothetical protein
VEVPDLEGAALSEIDVLCLSDGRVIVDGSVPRAGIDVIAATVSSELGPPWTARMIRRGLSEWAIGARRLDLDAVDLGELDGVEELSVARSPDGALTVLADGEEASASPTLDAAARELERLGAARHVAFVARAVRAGPGWVLTIDPL